MSSTPTFVQRDEAVDEAAWVRARRIDPIEQAQRDLLLSFTRLHASIEAGEVDEITFALDELPVATDDDLDEARAFADRFDD